MLTPSSATRYKQGVGLRTIVVLAYETLREHKVRFGLTALGMMIGTASLILVVSIGLTGKQYILSQIQAIGANMIEAYYEGGGNQASTRDDYLKTEDIQAVREHVPGIMFTSPMFEVQTPINVPGGKQRDAVTLGVSPEYQQIRKLMVVSGRFFDWQDRNEHNKVALMDEKLAAKLYGSPDAAIGEPLSLMSLPFTIIGTFRERVETFGQTEISDDTILIPDTVARYFSPDSTIKNAFFSVGDSSDVPRATEEIQQVLQSRHRPGAKYRVENLTELLSVAGKIANALTAVLLLISTVTLLVSGVGIMNIMVATVNSRIREIGVRKAVGATNAEIRDHFLSEAALIALSGGFVGLAVGLTIPFTARWLSGIHVPVSGWSVVIGILVSCAVGFVFGTIPATRASKLDPVECLRWE